MNGIAKPRIGNGVAYFVAAGSLAAFGVAAWLVGAGEARDTWPFVAGSLGVAVAVVATGFVVRLFGLVERRLIEIQASLEPVDSRPSSGPSPSPVGIDRYGLPLRPPEIAGFGAGG